MPAQWQRLPLKTQQEMLAGRNALKQTDVMEAAFRRWANEGVGFIINNLPGAKAFDFDTLVDVDARTVALSVYKKAPLGTARVKRQLVFAVVEPAERFVTHLTMTKLIMVT